MANWTLVGTASAVHNTAANFAFTWPAGTQADDVALVVEYQEVDTAVTVTPGGSFLARRSGENTASTPDIQYLAWSKILTATESGTLTFTHSSTYRAACLVIVRPPAGTGTPALDVESAAVTAPASATTNNIAAITLTQDDTVVLAGGNNFAEENLTTWTSPFVTGGQVTSGANGGGVVIGYATKATGTTGTVTITWATACVSNGAMHAFKTGGGGGGGTVVKTLAAMGVG